MSRNEPLLGDPPEVISVCLTCRRDTCVNCMARSRRGRRSNWKEKPSPPKGVDIEKFVTLYNLGMSHRKIAELLGVTDTSIRRFMERCNLPFAREKRPLLTTENYGRFRI